MATRRRRAPRAAAAAQDELSPCELFPRIAAAMDVTVWGVERPPDDLRHWLTHACETAASLSEKFRLDLVAAGVPIENVDARMRAARDEMRRRYVDEALGRATQAKGSA
jgi:hypothetical protein